MNSSVYPPVRINTEETRTEQENGGSMDSQGGGGLEAFLENASSFLEKPPPEGHLGPQGDVGFSLRRQDGIVKMRCLNMNRRHDVGSDGVDLRALKHAVTNTARVGTRSVLYPE